MDKLDFWSPIRYCAEPQPFSTKLVSWVDSYFDCWMGNILNSTLPAYVPPQHLHLGERKVVVCGYLPDSSSMVALKMISHLTLVIPAAMLLAKGILRTMYTFSRIDVKKMVEGDIDISPETLAKVDRIVKGWEDSDCVMIESKKEVIGRSRIFTLRSQPDLIFRSITGLSDFGEERWYLKSIALVNGLRDIVIPPVKKLEIPGSESSDYNIYVERRLNYVDADRERLSDTTKQELGLFLEKTKYRYKDDWLKVRNRSQVAITFSLNHDNKRFLILGKGVAGLNPGY